MGFLEWIALIALSGPFIGVALLIADAYSGGRPTTTRRLIIAGVAGGVLTVGAGGLLIEIAPEHPPGFFLGGLVAGAAYGLIVGLFAAALRPSFTHHDPTA